MAQEWRCPECNQVEAADDAVLHECQPYEICWAESGSALELVDPVTDEVLAQESFTDTNSYLDAISRLRSLPLVQKRGVIVPVGVPRSLQE